MIHFALSSYGRALPLPTSSTISGLARFREKSRLSRSIWKAFASTHPLILFPTSPRKVLFACSRSDPSLSGQGATLPDLDSLHSYDLVICTFVLFLFSLAKAAMAS